MLFVGSLAMLTACEDDRDSNPTIQQPTEFVLNTPAYATSDIDLKNSTELRFTCSQPNYGYTAAVTYQVQISLTNSFTLSTDEVEEGQTADYAVIDESYTTCNISTDASLFSTAVMTLGGWTEDAVPATLDVYVRLYATVGDYSIASNVVTISVVPYYIELTDALPQLWYLVGNCIGDGAWSNNAAAIGVSIYPMSIVKDYEYDAKTGDGEYTFTGYFPADAEFKILKTVGSWDYGFCGGSSAGTTSYRDGGDDPGNITVPAAGYYTITLNSSALTCTIEAADITPTVYESMCITGAFAGDDWPDVAMTAVNTVTENHIWTYTLDTTSGDTEAKFKISGSWDTNWGSTEFPYGVGTSGGSNIPVTAGKYIVIFNDIDGSYHFIATE